MLLSEINVAYYQHLMQGMREAIAGGTFETFRKQRAPVGRRAIYRRARVKSPERVWTSGQAG